MKIKPRTEWSDLDVSELLKNPRSSRRNFPIYVAVYLPWKNGKIDWISFKKILQRVYDARCIPVVNADTGWAFLLSEAQKKKVVEFVVKEFPGKLLVAAVTAGGENDPFSADAYKRAVDMVQISDKVRIMMMISPGLTALRGDELIAAYAAVDNIRYGIMHELTAEFVPFGRELTPYEFHGTLSLPHFFASKTSRLAGPAIAPRMALKQLTGLKATITSGVDYKVREAFVLADGILMGAATLFPKLFKKLLELYRKGLKDPVAMLVFEEIVVAVQNAVSFQFLPDAYHPTFDVGNYRACTGQILTELDVIQSDEVPAGVKRFHRRPRAERRTVKSVIRELRYILEQNGLNADELLS